MVINFPLFVLVGYLALASSVPVYLPKVVPSGLTAYDCSLPTSRKTVLDISNAAKCQIPPRSSLVPEYFPEIQVLQAPTKIDIKVHKCSVKFHRFSYWCGDLNQVFPQDKMFTVQQMELTNSECADMVRSHTYSYSKDHVYKNLRPEAINNVDVTLSGSQNSAGTCSRGTFNDGSVSLTSSVVTGTMEIQFKTIVGSYEPSTGKVILPDAVCNIKDQGCTSVGSSTYIWEQQLDYGCETSKYRLVYQGPGKVINTTSARGQPPKLLTVETDKHAFALPLVDSQNLCNRQVWVSADERLIVVLPSEFGPIKGLEELSSENVDFSLHISGKIQLVEGHIGNQMDDLYAQVFKQQCELYDAQLQSYLSIARIDPTEFATMILGPGHMAQDYFDALLITSCTRVSVTLSPNPTCTREVPVKYLNETWYVAPRTRILQKVATPRICNEDSAPAGDLGGVWYHLWPTFTMAEKRPDQMTLNYTAEWKYTSLGDLITRGLYDPETAKAASSRVLAPAETKAIQESMAMAASGRDVSRSGWESYNIFSPADRKRIVQDGLITIDNWVVKLGLYGAFFWTISTMVKLMLLLCNTTINLRLLYQMYGWSKTLLACCLTSLAHYFVTKAVIRDKEEESNKQEKSTEIPMQSQTQALYPNLNAIIQP